MANVTVTDVGPCKKQLKITIPQADVKAKVDEGYAKLASSATISGFRKGHVPRKLLERRFGEDVLEEVKQGILAEASEKAIEEQGLKPIGEPSFDNVTFDMEQDCVFEVTLEVEPTFEVNDYQGLKATRKSTKVTEEELSKGLENVRMQRARLESLEAGATVTAGDVVKCDWSVSSEGEVVADEKDAEVFAKGKRSGGLELEQDLGDALAGAAFGEAREVKGAFSENYPIEKWRGKPGAAKLTVKGIRRPVMPEINEEFAKSLDFESLDELKKALERNLSSQKEREVRMDLEKQVFDRLLEKTPIELPQGVLKAQARNIMMRQQYRLRQRGVPAEEIEKHLEDLRNASEEAAERNLKIFFILNKIADREKIFVTENEVEARIAEMAAGYRMSPQKMRAQIEQEGSLSELRAGMREDKVTEFLIKNAQIEQE